MKKFKVVTLCGSTRFQREFEDAQNELTLEGNVVLSVCVFGHGRNRDVFEKLDKEDAARLKQMLDDMHRQKIDMAQDIMVINPGGYVGQSTWREIVYAAMTGKGIRSLAPISEDEIHTRACVYLGIAERFAARQLDVAHHSQYMSMDDYVTIAHKGEEVIDPWLRPEHQSEPFAWKLHEDPDFRIDPIEYYGGKKAWEYVAKVNQIIDGYEELYGESFFEWEVKHEQLDNEMPQRDLGSATQSR